MEKVITGGCVPTFQITPEIWLHYFGETIEVTNSRLQIKAIYKKVGWLNE